MFNIYDWNEIRSIIDRNGYATLDVADTGMSIQEIASMIGNIVPGERGEVIQELHARDRGEGRYGTFSYCVGYNQFPWHTDTAYWEIPVRYLLLTSNNPSPCATTFRTFRSLASKINRFHYLAERAVYLLNIPGRKRYLSPIFKRGREIGYRLDFHIYKPMNKEAQSLIELVSNELSEEYGRIVWTGNNIAILDNWKAIHSREDAHEDKNRTLTRIYINDLV